MMLCVPLEVEFGIAVAQPGRVTFQDLHWLVSTWLDRGHGGGLSDSAPAHTDDKPYTLRGATAAASSSALLVRLGLLDDRVPGLDEITVADDLAAGIRRAVEKDPERPRLGGQSFRCFMRDSDRGPEAFRVVEYESWSDLAAAPPRVDWSLVFDSPTSFRSGSTYVPFPLPERILTRLCAVWNSRAPQELHTDCGNSGDDCVHGHVVKTVDYATVTARGWPRISIVGQNAERAHGMNPGVQKSFLGFTGQTTIGLRTDRDPVPDSVAREVSMLLAFSRYAGVGTGTARGFGATTPTVVRRKD